MSQRPRGLIFAPILLSAVFLMGGGTLPFFDGRLFTVARAAEQTAAEDACTPFTREQLFQYITADVSGQPRYRTWPIFPSNHTPSSDQAASGQAAQYSQEYFLKRLGLPVHGRWGSVYVFQNEAVRTEEFLKKAIKQPPSEGRLELPDCSIIVKENFRTDEFFKPADNTNPVPEGLSLGTPPRPAVLTVIYKNPAAPCASGRTFNGKNCFGGEWMWEFYGVNPVSIALNPYIEAESFCINCHAPAYNSDYLRSLQAQRRSVQAAHSGQPETPQAGKPDYCDGLTALSSVLSGDVGANPSQVEDPQKMFDCLSWQTFTSLNWPADPTDRGQPNPNITKVSDPDFLTGPRVWETYKETYEVFQPENPDWAPPSEWNIAQPPPEGEGCSSDGLPVLSMISKSRSGAIRTFDVDNEINQAFAGSFGTLIDQNGNFVRYEVRFNRDEFDYIIDTQSAVTVNLTPAGPPQPVLPDNITGKFGGSIEIKAAWREMCTPEWEQRNAKQCFPKVDDLKRYYVREVLVYRAKEKKCEQKTMGLIALHIAHKTFWAPQWVWSTFSHIDNVPSAKDPNPPATPFFNPERVAQAKDECWKQPFLISPPDCPNVELNRYLPPPSPFPPNSEWPKLPNGQPLPWPGTDLPNQVTRLAPIQGSGLNAVFAKLFDGTPFANYVLLNTQWPLQGRDSKGQINNNNCPENGFGEECFTMIPLELRNPVVETYMSTYDYQRQQFSNRSCMGCHTESGADASYIWLDGVEQVVPIAAHTAPSPGQ